MKSPGFRAMKPDSAAHGSDAYLSGPLAAMSRQISAVCFGVAALALCIKTLLILWQVFARYILNDAPPWSEQMTLWLLIWLVLFGAAAGVREQFHIKITAMQDASGPATRRAMGLVCHAVSAMIGAALAFYGTELVNQLWRYPIPTLGLPRGSAFLPLPLAGTLIVLFSIEHIIAINKNRAVRPLWS